MINVCNDKLYSSGTESTSTCTYPWHPTNDFKGCTNSPPGTYPNDWTASDVRHRYLYRSHEECCISFFDYNTVDDCPKVNDCPTEEGNAETTQSTTLSASSPPTPCAADNDNKWHRGAQPNICTNDLNYPFAWDDPATTHEYLHGSPEECCASDLMKTDTCIVEDICGVKSGMIDPDFPMVSGADYSTTTATATAKATSMVTSSAVSTVASSTTGQVSMNCESWRKRKGCVKDSKCNWNSSSNSCVVDHLAVPNNVAKKEDGENDYCAGKKYHPKSASDHKCSNDDVYPLVWIKEPNLMSRYFFASSEECCEAFYGDGPCEVVNICSGSTNDVTPQSHKAAAPAASAKVATTSSHNN